MDTNPVDGAEEARTDASTPHTIVPPAAVPYQSVAALEWDLDPSWRSQVAERALAAEVLRRLTHEVRGGIVATAAFPTMGILLVSLFASNLTTNYPWLVLTAAGMCASAALFWAVDRQELARAAGACAHMDKSHIGALCETLECPSQRVRGATALLLTDLLPRLGPEDEDLLTREQKHFLYRRLGARAARRNPDLTVAILRALPLIGTEGALPYVERLTTQPVFSRAGRRIASAAAAALPAVEERTGLQRAAEAARAAAAASLEASREEALPESERQRRAAAEAEVDRQFRQFETELRKLRQPGMRWGFLAASWGIIVPYTAFQSFQQFSAGQWPAGAIWGVLTLLSTQLYRLTVTNAHKTLATRLGQMSDVRFIGRMTELLNWSDPLVESVAIGALTRLLPQVKASDAVLSTDVQRLSLYRRLALADAAQYAEFQVAILTALAQIGDAAAVPHVRALANAIPTNARQRRVCDAATDCLPYLEHRAKLTSGSQILLRASSATSTGADTLVRAASASAANQPDQLLRADTGDSSH